MSPIQSQDLKELLKAFVSLTSEEDVEDFLADLCTFKEVESMAQRLRAAKMLMEGATYEQIIAQTDISSATLSRVSKCVKYGDGYKKVLSLEQ